MDAKDDVPTALGHLQIGEVLIFGEQDLLLVDHVHEVLLDDGFVELLVALLIDGIEQPSSVEPLAFVMPQFEKIVDGTFRRETDAQVAEELRQLFHGEDVVDALVVDLVHRAHAFVQIDRAANDSIDDRAKLFDAFERRQAQFVFQSHSTGGRFARRLFRGRCAAGAFAWLFQDELRIATVADEVPVDELGEDRDEIGLAGHVHLDDVEVFEQTVEGRQVLDGVQSDDVGDVVDVLPVGSDGRVDAVRVDVLTKKFH